MYLSKLELHGFKSFAAHTALAFDAGITAIVGPNGCGKSNIVDAVRWVIGEQRARILRSEKMENVIFNGTSKRRPLGMAEVLLTIENNRGVLPIEYAEVTLGRRLYRSGESEYLLNGTPCRLKDIVDLFMDTGMGAGAYSVIELKMVEEILSDHAPDRRHLFEEAAGITKYKQRRAQTLRKLDGTQTDLTRLRDLTEEIGKRVNSLKRQAAKAARYREHHDRLHRLELALAQVEHDRLTAQQHVLQAEMRQLADALKEHTARLATDEARLEALRKTLIEREALLSEHQQQLNEHLTSVRDLEADARLEQERLDGAVREQERTAREQEEARKQRSTLERYAEHLAGELAEAEPLKDEAEHVLRQAQAARDEARATAQAQHASLQALREQEQRVADERAEHRRRLDRLTNRLELLEQERTRIFEQLVELEEDIRKHEALAKQAGRRLEEAKKAVRAAEAARDEAGREHDAWLHRLEEAAEALRHAEREHDAADAETHLLQSLVSSFDEFSDAVRFLAADAAWTPAPLQTVADLLACEPAHRVALDAALGDLAACIVVRTEEEARRAVALLRAEHKGRAIFLVLERLPAEAPLDDAAPATNGVAARPMRTLVRVSNPEHERMAALLLRDCYLVEALDEALALAAPPTAHSRYVAASGEWTDRRGLLHAGSAPEDRSPVATRIGRREQLEAAAEHLAALKAELERRAADVEALRAGLDALPLEAHRRTLAEAEQAQTAADREHARAAYELQTLERRRADLADRLTALEAESATLHADVEPLGTSEAEAGERLAALRARGEAVETAFLAAEAESRAAQDRFGEASVAAVEARNRHDNLERDLARTRQEVQALDRRAGERSAHLETLQQTIEAARQKLALLQTRIDDVRAHRDGLETGVARAKTALLKTRADIDEVEFRLRKLRQAREETIREENTRAVRQAEIQTRKEDLLAGIRENYDRDLAEDPVEIDADFEEQAARARVQALRRKIQTLGSVNALALEEYETERERFEFMRAQQEDLEKAEATLLETIHEINTTAAARFNETFEAIRTSFRGLFSELFGQEATADLMLAAPDDPLESPIEIMAKPRGKRPVSIAQLSSGEKTLTAIALLFAIYLVKPSPFCILDEVDAPLDDANIDRFMRLIRRFAAETQFILVTHNKRTMEMADRLYGITMQEQGVSGLVGVRFDEALAMAE